MLIYFHAPFIIFSSFKKWYSATFAIQGQAGFFLQSQVNYQQQMSYTTERLLLNELESTDTTFILELLNTPGWIQFIGNRNINTRADADAYIQKVKSNPDIQYWVVRLQETRTAVGIISFIKRTYLDHYDIGFAYLPQYNGKGYAYEAAAAVLADKLDARKHPVILATTKPDNKNSIHLLLKLGFVYSRDVLADNEKLMLYAIESKKQ